MSAESKKPFRCPYTSAIYSGARHAFSVPGSDRYQERAETESWQAFGNFLKAQMGS